jgi:hypothetical protein
MRALLPVNPIHLGSLPIVPPPLTVRLGTSAIGAKTILPESDFPTSGATFESLVPKPRDNLPELSVDLSCAEAAPKSIIVSNAIAEILFLITYPPVLTSIKN